jgi:hypothetical protein
MVDRLPGLRAASALAGALLVALLACGCGRSSLPRTYKVTGTVKATDGLEVANGAIQFASLSDSSFTASGDVGTDGSFQLSTVQGNTRVNGIPEGEYRVTVIPPLGKDRRATPIVLPQTYKIEPKDMHLTITVSKPKQR